MIIQDMKEGEAMDQKIQYKRSPLSYYVVGIYFLVYACLFPLYRFIDYIICIIIAFVVYVVSGLLFPREKMVKEIILEKKSNDEYCNMILQDMKRYMEELHALTMLLEKKELCEQLNHILQVSDDIRNALLKEPQKSRKMRKFVNVTYPTLITILKRYDELENEHKELSSFQSGMEKVEQEMKQFEQVFVDQYESLFQDKLSDIDAELEVVEQMIEKPKGGIPHE